MSFCRSREGVILLCGMLPLAAIGWYLSRQLELLQRLEVYRSGPSSGANGMAHRVLAATVAIISAFGAAAIAESRSEKLLCLSEQRDICVQGKCFAAEPLRGTIIIGLVYEGDKLVGLERKCRWDNEVSQSTVSTDSVVFRCLVGNQTQSEIIVDRLSGRFTFTYFDQDENGRLTEFGKCEIARTKF